MGDLNFNSRASFSSDIYSVQAMLQSDIDRRASVSFDDLLSAPTFCAAAGGTLAALAFGTPAMITLGIGTGLVAGAGLSYQIWQKHQDFSDRMHWVNGSEKTKRMLAVNDPSVGKYSLPISHQGTEVRLHYFEAGKKEAPTLLLVHGFGSNAYQFSQIFDELSQKYHVIAVDLPGCGYSDPLPNDHYEFETSVKQVMTTFIEQQQWTDITLVMSSLGGPVGEQLASSNPNISQLIFFNGMEPRGNLTLMTLMIGTTGLLQKGLVWFADATNSTFISEDFEKLSIFTTIGFFGHPSLGTISDHDLNEFAKPLVYYQKSNPERSRRLMAARASYALNEATMLYSSDKFEKCMELQKNLNQRSLVVQSEWDRFVPTVLAKRLEETLPNAEMLLIPHYQVPTAGHTLMSDNPRIALSIIDDFMQKRIPADSPDDSQDVTYLSYNPWQPNHIYQRKNKSTLFP